MEATACTYSQLFLRQPCKAAAGGWAIQTLDASHIEPLYISLVKTTKLLHHPNLAFSMLSADKRFKYITCMFLLKIGDNVKKQNFLPSSGRGSGQRIRELGGRKAMQALCNCVP